MRDVIYSLTISLDGYMKDPDGGIDWGAPDEEVFALATNEVRGLGYHLLGRRLYETMLYWNNAESDRSLSPPELEFARIWNALPKVVFSTTLAEVEGSNTRLATGTVDEEIERLRAEPGEGDIAVGGAELAAAVAAHDLIDEYRVRVCPILLGGGTPFFAQGRQVALELVEARGLASGVTYLRHRVIR